VGFTNCDKNDKVSLTFKSHFTWKPRQSHTRTTSTRDRR